ncbi:MAG: HAD family hydrolase [Fluviicola sp.]
MRTSIKTIAFDADDTLWVNEPYFRDAEKEFCGMLENYLPKELISEELFHTEMKNLHLYGYGAKGFMLSMIETITSICGQTASMELIRKTIELGQEILAKPVELIPGVEETLETLSSHYRLVVATKGDLLDQESKLKKSGLAAYFHHVEIMSNKKKEDYEKLMKRLDCSPDQFLMLGNSIKSDVLPVLELGAFAAHIPYHVTWAHEQHETDLKYERFLTLRKLNEIINHLR